MPSAGDTGCGVSALEDIESCSKPLSSKSGTIGRGWSSWISTFCTTVVSSVCSFCTLKDLRLKRGSGVPGFLPIGESYTKC